MAPTEAAEVIQTLLNLLRRVFTEPILMRSLVEEARAQQERFYWDDKLLLRRIPASMYGVRISWWQMVALLKALILSPGGQ